MNNHPQLVLSLFPGIGLLDRAFEEEGFCVVRGPDLLWGGDVKQFLPPAGRFDGVIGGPPCQVFSPARQLRAGTNCRSVNLIPEFQRCVAEARPSWFLMENVPKAPVPHVAGYHVHAQLLDNRWCGGAQQRRRRFSFGALRPARLNVQTVALEHIERYRAILASDGKRAGKGCNLPNRRHTLSAQKIDFALALRLQGLPEGFLSDAPFTVEGKHRVVGNGVPLPMGRAISRAVKEVVWKGEL